MNPFGRLRDTPVLRGLPREVGVIAAIAFCVALGFGIVAPAIPIYAKTFGVSAFLAGAVVSVFALMRLLSSPAAGGLVDRIGERRVLTTGLLIVAVSSVFAGLAQTYPQLIVLRGLGGIGSSMFTVSAMALTLKVVAPDQRGRAAGAFQAGFLLGGVAGPAVGGLVVGWSIRAPFFVYALTLLLAAYVSWQYLPREAPGQPIMRRDLAGGVAPDEELLTLPTGEAFADSSPEDRSATSGDTDSSLSKDSRQPGTPPTDPPSKDEPLTSDAQRDSASKDGSLMGSAADDPLSEAHEPPTLRQALRSRAYQAALTGNLVNGFVTFGLRFSLVPLFVVESLHGGPGLAGAGFLVAAATQALLLLPAGRMADTRGRRPAMLLGAALTLLGMGGLAVANAEPVFLLAMAVSGLATAFMGSAPAAVAGDVVGRSGKGIVIAVFQMTADLGAILGPLIAGLLADSLGYSAAFAVGAAVTLLALTWAVLMPETLRRSAAAEA